MREVTSAEVAEYLPLVNSYARRFHGKGGAEYDDLVQEGWLKVFLLLRDDKPVSRTAIKNAMRDWVRFCYRHGHSNGTVHHVDVETIAA
jgi:DNA-directed RNA polymerase specialized sigma24 family protein